MRTRSAHDFAWSFTAPNLVGISPIGLRSWEIGEWAFVTVNAFTAGFWALVLVMKAKQGEGVQRGLTATPAPPASGR